MKEIFEKNKIHLRKAIGHNNGSLFKIITHYLASI
jgi:hypothetical protein